MLCLADEVFGNRVANKEKLLLSFLQKDKDYIFRWEGTGSKVKTLYSLHYSQERNENRKTKNSTEISVRLLSDLMYSDSDVTLVCEDGSLILTQYQSNRS